MFYIWFNCTYTQDKSYGEDGAKPFAVVEGHFGGSFHSRGEARKIQNNAAILRILIDVIMIALVFILFMEPLLNINQKPNAFSVHSWQFFFYILHTKRKPWISWHFVLIIQNTTILKIYTKIKKEREMETKRKLFIFYEMDYYVKRTIETIITAITNYLQYFTIQSSTVYLFILI